MTDRNEPNTKDQPEDLPSDLLHDSGEAGGDPDSHLGASRDHQPRAADDGPDAAKLQRTPGEEPEDNDAAAPGQDSTGVAPS